MTSLEAQVDVYSEETLTGKRLLTSRAFLTFVAVARDGSRVPLDMDRVPTQVAAYRAPSGGQIEGSGRLLARGEQ